MKNKLMNFETVINCLRSSMQNGTSCEGAMQNTLTMILNQLHPVGGWSVTIKGNEIFIHQHQRAGEGYILIP